MHQINKNNPNEQLPEYTSIIKINNNRSRTWYWHVIVAALILISSFYTSIISGKKTDIEEKSQFLSLAEVVPFAIDPNKNLLPKLSASPEDVNLNEYKEIKQKLKEMADTISYSRWTYLMLERNGGILFIADEQPSKIQDSSNSSSPGEIYEDAPPELREVFRTGKATVVGPYTDKWGSFISAFVPITDNNGKVIACFGVDVEAREWMSLVGFRYISSFLIGILLIIIYTIFIVYKSQKNKRTTEEEFVVHYEKKSLFK